MNAWAPRLLLAGLLLPAAIGFGAASRTQLAEVTMPMDYTATQQITLLQALNPKGSKLVGSERHGANSVLRYSGDTYALARLLDDLRRSPKAFVQTRFETLPGPSPDWTVDHRASANAFTITINNNSNKITPDKLAIAEVASSVLLRKLLPEHPHVYVVGNTIMAGRPAGVGILLEEADGFPTVTGFLPRALEKARKEIHVNDRILSVAQGTNPAVSTAGLNMERVANLIRGSAGTEVTLNLVAAGHPEADPYSVTFTREELNPYGLRLGTRIPIPLPQPGMAAPPLIFRRLSDGKRDELAHYAGRYVVLEFWSSKVVPCVHTMAEMQEDAVAFAAQKDRVVFITVSIDEDMESPTKRIAEMNWNKTLNAWALPEALGRWYLDEVPVRFLIDPDGIVVELSEWDSPATMLQRHLK